MKIGIKDGYLIVIDTRKFAIDEPLKIPIEQIKELIKKHKCYYTQLSL